MNEITQFLLNHGGPVLFAIVFAEQAGLPLPSAPWLLTAGALTATGKLSPIVAVTMTALACVMADALWFYVGRRGGQRVLRLFCRLSLAPNACVGRTKGLLARHGLQALVAAKFIPGFGAVMPPLAGALGVGVGRFLLFDGFGSLFYGGFYISAGFLFHDQLERVLAILSKFGFSALLLGLILVPGYVLLKYVWRSRRATRQTVDGHAGRAEAQLAHPGKTPASARSLEDAARKYSKRTRSPAAALGALAVTSATIEGESQTSFVQPTPCGL